jgi:hypothetical protein
MLSTLVSSGKPSKDKYELLTVWMYGLYRLTHLSSSSVGPDFHVIMWIYLIGQTPITISLGCFLMFVGQVLGSLWKRSTLPPYLFLWYLLYQMSTLPCVFDRSPMGPFLCRCHLQFTLMVRPEILLLSTVLTLFMFCTRRANCSPPMHLNKNGSDWHPPHPHTKSVQNNS